MFKKRFAADAACKEIVSLLADLEGQSVSNLEDLIRTRHTSFRFKPDDKPVVGIWLVSQSLLSAHNVFKNDVARKIVLGVLNEYANLKKLDPVYVGAMFREIKDRFQKEYPRSPWTLEYWLFDEIGADEALSTDPALLAGIEAMMTHALYRGLLKDWSRQFKIY